MTRAKIHSMEKPWYRLVLDRVRSLLGMSPDQNGAPVDGDAGVCFVCLISENSQTMNRVTNHLFAGMGCEFMEVQAHRALTGAPVRVLFARWLSHETYICLSSRFTTPHGWISRNAFEGNEGLQAVMKKVGIVLPGSASHFERSQR